jgi:4-hydroxy-tetrahydrodipicolinate reductase
MGTQVCAAVQQVDDLELVGRFGRGDDLGDVGGADVAVELTVPDSTVGNVLHCIDRGVHVVVGTTGWDDDRLAEVRRVLTSRADVGVLVAPNFSVGAALMMRFAEQAARFFESAEVIELHHPDKIDAPSGTAALTARRVARARAEAGRGAMPDATTTDPGGARGAVVDGVHVHSVRLRGLVAHQEVLLGSSGEQLTIRHDSYDRASFVPGVLAAVRAVPSHPGLTVGLERVLDLP